MLITTHRLGDSLGAPSHFFNFTGGQMKRTLIHLMLLIVLVGTILAPSAMAQRHRRDREAARICERTYRDALRAARGLPYRQRRIRMNEARREHADCLRRAWH
jgi:hypothetical protein